MVRESWIIVIDGIPLLLTEQAFLAKAMTAMSNQIWRTSDIHANGTLNNLLDGYVNAIVQPLNESKPQLFPHLAPAGLAAESQYFASWMLAFYKSLPSDFQLW